jgi:hypothetical protein
MIKMKKIICFCGRFKFLFLLGCCQAISENSWKIVVHVTYLYMYSQTSYYRDNGNQRVSGRNCIGDWEVFPYNREENLDVHGRCSAMFVLSATRIKICVACCVS